MKKQETIDRDKDFAEVCRRLIVRYRKSMRKVTFSALLQEAMNTRPDHHYVSYDSALRMLYLIRRGKCKDFSNPDTAEKWAELNAQLNTVMERRPQLTFPRAVAFMLTYKRPARFRIPMTRARVILRRVICDETHVELHA